ncbi:iron complex outermembrane recepter protein [Cohaesibacter gelatinilyticus]|uniref:Iron complex outermembrane recepter protein n=2 Tax=Cohaesibacter gelatinilyticus TaxID=372072 RepID=A0A285ND31_9HYPH|nr:iron complex outermembrane recepter protein [Cohaesibacter gelatinilyticus]
MSNHVRLKKHQMMLIIGISIFGVIGHSDNATAADFIETQSMMRHAAGGPPAVPSPLELLLAKPAMQFRHDDQLPMTTGVEGDVAKANRMVKVMGGYNGDGSVKTGAAQARLMAPGIVVLAGMRYDQADDYDDADGNEVKFGYKRDTEQLVIQWMPNAGGKLKLVGIRDVIQDDIQPHHAMDVPTTTRYVGKASFEQALEGDVLKGFGLNFASKNVEREPDNYTNRDDGNPGNNMRALTKRHILEGDANAKLNLGGWATTAAVSGGWDNHDARRYQDSQGGIINAIKLPDITRTMFGLSLDSKRNFENGFKLQAGVRYDYIHADPEAVNETGQVVNPPPAAPAFNMSPAALYGQYYGASGDFKRDDHNISARLRVSKAAMDNRFSVFADLSRKVRSPDNIEAYHAVTNPTASARWIGNPNLDPEAHHKAELGFIWTGANYKGYGQLSPNAEGPFDADNMKVSLSGYVDAVDNFIAFDRAHGQTGILQNDNALIYRNIDALFAGVNFEARWNLTNNWSTAVKAAYLWGNNESDNRALYQIAPLEANFLIDYRDMLGSVGTWNIGAKLRVVADQSRVDTNVTTGLGMDQSEGKGFATIDAYGGIQIGNRWSVTAGVNNLLNADYQEHITGTHVAAATKTKINAPGRNFFLRSQLNF